MRIVSILLITASITHADISDRPITIRLPPQNRKPNFMKEMAPPRPMPLEPATSVNRPQKLYSGNRPSLTPAAQLPVIPPVPATEQQFVPRPITTPPPPPPINIPPDVQNQLIKFFGLDSFGIPGLTGNHPDGFAGAIQELRAAGIPVQGLPLEHISGNLSPSASQNDVLSQANPAFGNQLNQLYNEATGPTSYRGPSDIPLPEATPGENGLIGFLSSSIRKLVQDTGVADALSQGIPSVLGTGGSSDASVAYSTDAEAEAAAQTASRSGIRRQQNTAQRVLSGVAAALGGGGGRGPVHAGLPRIPGIPLLPSGIPRNEQGQIDVVQLIGSITRRVSNGTTLADVIPPEQLQTLADNVTDALLPPTPEDFNLHKFMGRWFEGINSPRATEQRCVVHHYGGLTKNDKTATFTALKIYREGSEFGPVRYSIGYAFRGGNKDAMLQLHSSETPDAQPFWIYKLGPEGTDPFGNPQYEWAVVSNWVKYPVTVLVRDPDRFKAKYEQEVLRWLEDQGFINGFIRAFNMLQPASYSSCQYADSTFEVFGPSKRLT
uniref:Lipocalin domain-containing protein n=1 Tax=Onchocerca volvulus TaxID=6282 RepID=A0A8R1TTN5_ONCVO